MQRFLIFLISIVNLVIAGKLSDEDKKKAKAKYDELVKNNPEVKNMKVGDLGKAIEKGELPGGENKEKKK